VVGEVEVEVEVVRVQGMRESKQELLMVVHGDKLISAAL
jgi:hypothetical protein